MANGARPINNNVDIARLLTYTINRGNNGIEYGYLLDLMNHYKLVYNRVAILKKVQLNQIDIY